MAARDLGVESASLSLLGSELQSAASSLPSFEYFQFLHRVTDHLRGPGVDFWPSPLPALVGKTLELLAECASGDDDMVGAWDNRERWLSKAEASEGDLSLSLPDHLCLAIAVDLSEDVPTRYAAEPLATALVQRDRGSRTSPEDSLTALVKGWAQAMQRGVAWLPELGSDPSVWSPDFRRSRER
jgi:hypothetical protein